MLITAISWPKAKKYNVKNENENDDFHFFFFFFNFFLSNHMTNRKLQTKSLTCVLWVSCDYILFIQITGKKSYHQRAIIIQICKKNILFIKVNMSRRLSLVTVSHEFLFRIDLSRHGAMNLDFKGAKKGTKIQLAFSPDKTFFFSSKWLIISILFGIMHF